MKLHHLYIASMLAAGLILTTSCSDSFLDKNSLTESSTETFWQTEDDATMAMVACYDGLQSNQIYGGGPWDLGQLNMDCMTDNGGHFNWSGWVEGYDIANGTHSASSWAVGSFWDALYEVVKRCNSLIANIDRVPMSETQNLKAAVPNLPVTAERGRLTRGAGYAILGRLALYNKMWDEAIGAYQEVMKLGYSLASDYTALFTPAGETQPEIIFAVRFEGPGLDEGAVFNAHWNTPIESMNGTLDLADDYYKLDGTKATERNYAAKKADGSLDVSKPNFDYWKGRDPRLYATLFVPGMYWNGLGGEESPYGGAASSLSTIYVMKYFDPTDTGNSWDNAQDFYVVRYAEVLLSLAEALVEKGSYNEANVLSLVNQVRQRVGMPKVEDVEGTGLSKDKLLQVVRHERRVELAFEGLRLYDEYRWHQLKEAIDIVNNERITYGLNYEPRVYNGERDYKWPIPTDEIDSNPQLKQHEGW